MALTREQQAAQIKQWVESGRARELRTNAGLSLSAVARDIEVSPSAVLMWERAERTPMGRNIPVYYRYLARLEAAQTKTAPTP